MTSVLIDIDDTLMDTQKKMQAILQKTIGCPILMKDVETLDPQQIFSKYASPDQKARADELRRQFQNLLLCLNEVGIELMRLDEPIPDAADTLQCWCKRCELVYVTGRLGHIREQTWGQLREHGFPTENAELAMIDPDEWRAGVSLPEARNRLLSNLSERHHIARVVDDFPVYFTKYRELNIPERFGLHRSRRFAPKDYFDRGATKVVESWKELKNNIPSSIA